MYSQIVRNWFGYFGSPDQRMAVSFIFEKCSRNGDMHS